MRDSFALFVGVATCLVCVAEIRAADPVSESDVRPAIDKGLPLLQQAAHRYPTHRACFSCHHQTLPLLAMTEARRAGFSIDEDILQEQWQHTYDNFESRIEGLRQGKRIGGDAATASYGLWTALIVDAKPDDVTQALGQYLLKRQQKDGFWHPSSNRPPLEGTDITTTVLSLYGLSKIATSLPDDNLESSVARAETWLASAAPKDQQERAFALWYAARKGNRDRLKSAIEAVRKSQRDDGGWAQKDDMHSDAYATGQTVYFLLEAGIPPEDETLSRGLRFLLDNQEEDGSWHVVTRSKPIQKWFDNGDPHDTDQFISTPAACWAVAALARSLPRPAKNN